MREMWVYKGDVADMVSCGYINEKTRLVFRSQFAMCPIYIQMSTKMWQFDVIGEMHHEKAINFLGELLTNSKVSYPFYYLKKNFKKQMLQNDRPFLPSFFTKPNRAKISQDLFDWKLKWAIKTDSTKTFSLSKQTLQRLEPSSCDSQTSYQGIL